MNDFLLGEQLRFYLSAGGVLGWTQVVALVVALQLLLTRALGCWWWRRDLARGVRAAECSHKPREALLRQSRQAGAVEGGILRWLAEGGPEPALPVLVCPVVIALLGIAAALGMILTFAGIYQLMVGQDGDAVNAKLALALAVGSSAIGYSGLLLEHKGGLIQAVWHRPLRAKLEAWRRRFDELGAGRDSSTRESDHESSAGVSADLRRGPVRDAVPDPVPDPEQGSRLGGEGRDDREEREEGPARPAGGGAGANLGARRPDRAVAGRGPAADSAAAASRTGAREAERPEAGGTAVVRHPAEADGLDSAGAGAGAARRHAVDRAAAAGRRGKAALNGRQPFPGTPLARLVELTVEHRQALKEQGIACLEMFIGLARSQPAMMAQLLGCSFLRLDALCDEAETLAGSRLVRQEALPDFEE